MKLLKFSLLFVVPSFVFLILTSTVHASFCKIGTTNTVSTYNQSTPCSSRSTQTACIANPYYHVNKQMTCTWDTSSSTTPPPSVIIGANPSYVLAGQNTTIDWETSGTGLTACTVTSNGNPSTTHTGLNSSFSEAPTPLSGTSVTYTATCTGHGSVSVTDSVTVDVGTIFLGKNQYSIKNLITKNSFESKGTVHFSIYTNGVRDLPTNGCKLLNTVDYTQYGLAFGNSGQTFLRDAYNLTNATTPFQIICKNSSGVEIGRSQVQTVNTQSGTLTSSVTSNNTTLCTIPKNQGTCTIPTTWSTTNPKNSSNTFLGGTPISQSNTGINVNTTFNGDGNISNGATTGIVDYTSKNAVDGENNGPSVVNDLATLQVTVKCDQSQGSTTWNGTICASTLSEPELTTTYFSAPSSTGNASQTSPILVNLSAKIKNGGTAPTGAVGTTFKNVFQISTIDPTGSGTQQTSLIKKPSVLAFLWSWIPKVSASTSTLINLYQTMSRLDTGIESSQITQSYSFTSNGIYWARACADISNGDLMTGTVNESNEDNNCSSWSKIIVGTTPINGECETTPIHWQCAVGTSLPANRVTGTSYWQWRCTGENGGTNAVCKENFYTITSSAGPGGTISPTGTTSYIPYNGTQIYNINPNIGYTATIGGTCPGVRSGNTYTAGPITASCTVIASFSNVNTVPAVTTKTPVANITQNGAVGGGKIDNNGGYAVTVSGIVWGTGINPTVALSTKTTGGSTTVGSPWLENITGLLPDTTYHYRAYATNSLGTGYGNDVSFRTSTSANLPDLTVSNIYPTTVPVGDSLFSATVTNGGPLTTGTSFTNLFQVSTKENGAGVITDYATSLMSALGANTSATTTKTITFSEAGTYYMRACADKNSAGNLGVITESVETNNCSPDWVMVNVIIPNCASGTIWNGSSCVADNLPDLVVQEPSFIVLPSPNLIKLNARIVNDPLMKTNPELNAIDQVFHNVFQISTEPNGVGNITTYLGDDISHLGNFGDSIFISSNDIALSDGLYYMRACADKNIAMSGSVIESNEGNNCNSDWIPLSIGTPPTGTLSADNCVIEDNASSCNTSLTWNTINPLSGNTSAITSNYPNANTVVYTGNSGSNKTAVVPYNSRNFYLYHNASPLSGITVSANCKPGSGWDGSKCLVGFNVCENGATNYPACDDFTGNPIDGGWGGEECGVCSACQQQCIRYCDNPTPANGGSQCPEDGSDGNSNDGVWHYTQSCGSCPIGTGDISNFTFKAIPTWVFKGKSSNLSWTSGKDYYCTSTTPGFDPAGASSGSILVYPTQTTTYNISCTKAGVVEPLTGTTKVRVINPKIIEI